MFLLNAASMGVPQKRERVFFICHNKQFKFPKLKLIFSEPAILYKEIEDDNYENTFKKCDSIYWKQCAVGKSLSTVHPKKSFFNSVKLNPNGVVNTMTASSSLYHYAKLKRLSNNELCLAGSYPLDYQFGKVKPLYLIGMSVPPVMIAQIAYEIKKQWLQ